MSAMEATIQEICQHGSLFPQNHSDSSKMRMRKIGLEVRELWPACGAVYSTPKKVELRDEGELTKEFVTDLSAWMPGDGKRKITEKRM